MNTIGQTLAKTTGVLSAFALMAVAGSAIAGNQPLYTILVKEGDMVSGVATFFRVDNVAVNNDGQWLVEGDTTLPNADADQVLLNNSGLLLREGDALAAPPATTLDSFDTIAINNNGDSGWNFFLDGPPSSEDSGVYFNSELVIQESIVSTAPELSPNTPYIGFFETKVNDANQILVMASIDDPNIASSVDRALVRVDYDPNAGTFTETVISKEGDDVFGAPITDFETGPNDFAFNNSASAIFVYDTTAPTSQDSGILLHIDGSNFLAAIEGQPAPFDPERLYGSFSSTTVDLNNNNDYVFKTNLAGPTADNTVIVRNATGFDVVARKNDVVPVSLGGVFQYENFGTSSTPVKIADTEEVLFYADWNDPDTSRDTALMIGLSPILLEGITLVEDFKVIAINNFQDGFDFSDNGRFIIAEVTLEDPATLEPLNAAILIDRFPDTTPPCLGDLNEDGIVDTADLGILLGDFGCMGPNCVGDIVPNGVVDTADLGALLGAFGTNCAPV